MSQEIAMSPVEFLRAASPEGAKSHLAHKVAVMDNPELQAVPTKYEVMVGIGGAAAHGVRGDLDCAGRYPRLPAGGSLPCSRERSRAHQ